jgi:hypothetical protein
VDVKEDVRHGGCRDSGIKDGLKVLKEGGWWLEGVIGTRDWWGEEGVGVCGEVLTKGVAIAVIGFSDALLIASLRGAGVWGCSR